MYKTKEQKNPYLTPSMRAVSFSTRRVIALSLEGSTEGNGESFTSGTESYGEDNGAW